jgi:hypothetical protein
MAGAEEPTFPASFDPDVDPTWLERMSGYGPGWLDAQLDPRFRAWVEIMEYQLELFFTNEVPALGWTDWDAAGLATAEAAALARFPDIDAVLADRNDEDGYSSRDGFVRYVGTVYTQRLGGRWINLPDEDGNGRPAVQLPFRDLPVVPDEYLTMAVSRRTGEEWAWVFDRAVRAHDEWQAKPDQVG